MTIQTHNRRCSPVGWAIWLTLLTTLLSIIGALPVASGEELIPTSDLPLMTLKDVTQGSLLFKTNEAGRYIPAPTLKTDVRISVTATIARTTLKQEFMNPSRRQEDWAEGVYVFPLPET